MLFRWMRSYANNQFNRYAIRNNNNSYVNSPYIFFYTWFYINTILCSCSSNRKLHWCKKKAEFLVYSGQYHSVYFYPFTHFPCSISLFLSLSLTRTHTTLWMYLLLQLQSHYNVIVLHWHIDRSHVLPKYHDLTKYTMRMKLKIPK